METLCVSIKLTNRTEHNVTVVIDLMGVSKKPAVMKTKCKYDCELASNGPNVHFITERECIYTPERQREGFIASLCIILLHPRWSQPQKSELSLTFADFNSPFVLLTPKSVQVCQQSSCKTQTH